MQEHIHNLHGGTTFEQIFDAETRHLYWRVWVTLGTTNYEPSAETPSGYFHFTTAMHHHMFCCVHAQRAADAKSLCEDLALKLHPKLKVLSTSAGYECDALHDDVTSSF